MDIEWQEFVMVYMPIGLILVGLILVPVYQYVCRGLEARRREIMSSFTPAVIKVYFDAFFQTITMKVEALDPRPREEKPAAPRGSTRAVAKAKTKQRDPEVAKKIEKKYTKKFERLFDDRFGKRCFLPPIVLLALVTVLIGAAGSAVVHQLVLWSSDTASLRDDGIVVGMALAGAYMWVLSDVIGRIHQRDLRPTDLYWYSFRFVVAAPFGFALSGLILESGSSNTVRFVAGLIGLTLGAFPTRSLFLIARRLVGARLKLERIAEGDGFELEKIQGIGREQAERFSDEGINTILQLAYADPVELTIRTAYAFSYVVDCCSQAIAWLTFEADLVKLRRYSLRGAQEVHTFVLELDKATEEPDEVMETNARLARATLEKVAQELTMPAEALERSFREVAWDPYTGFLNDVWQPAWN